MARKTSRGVPGYAGDDTFTATIAGSTGLPVALAADARTALAPTSDGPIEVIDLATRSDARTYNGHKRRYNDARRELDRLVSEWMVHCWSGPNAEEVIKAVSTYRDIPADNVERTRSGNPINIDPSWDPYGIPWWVYLLALFSAGDPGPDLSYGY